MRMIRANRFARIALRIARATKQSCEEGMGARWVWTQSSLTKVHKQMPPERIHDQPAKCGCRTAWQVADIDLMLEPTPIAGAESWDLPLEVGCLTRRGGRSGGVQSTGSKNIEDHPHPH